MGPRISVGWRNISRNSNRDKLGGIEAETLTEWHNGQRGPERGPGVKFPNPLLIAMWGEEEVLIEY